MGTIAAICISEEKGVAKQPVKQADFKKDWGIIGDAHSGKWSRQVSLLSGESIDTMKIKLPLLDDGAFAENIVTRGIDLKLVKIGDKIQIGKNAILQITKIGKNCHNDGCAIKQATGDCIMPREGLFARVLQSGPVQKGDLLQRL